MWRDLPAAFASRLVVEPGALLVGHSAAGLLLPSLACLLDASGMVFIDARLPPPSGPAPPAEPEFMRFVQSLPIGDDGRLPPWSAWWGEGAMERAFEDAEMLRDFERELPRLPLSWFDDVVDVPPWDDLSAAYLQTSQLFAAETRDAQHRGWPAQVLEGTHLTPMVEPRPTADALLTLLDALACG